LPVVSLKTKGGVQFGTQVELDPNHWKFALQTQVLVEPSSSLMVLLIAAQLMTHFYIVALNMV